MKKVLLAIVVLTLVFTVSNLSPAAGKLSLSVGADVLLPMGTFGDLVSTGFGGSVRGQYDFTPLASGGLTIGYYTWSGKDIEGFKANFKGVPVRVFGKYYFMPEGEKVRVYGMAELGLFFGSVDVPGVQTAFGTIGGGSASETDFNYAPELGAEFALGGGGTKIDVSLRYDGISATGGSDGSIGARVGVNFPLGN